MRGVGVATAKSALFTLVSLQPPSLRIAAVALVSAGITVPSKQFPVP